MSKLILPSSILFLSLVSTAEPILAEPLPADHAERMKQGTKLFQSKIRPALVENCLKCHGDEKVRSGLDISSRELLLKGGDTGEAVDLSEPKNSFLLALIRHQEEPEMPPKANKLSDSLIADFEKWIAMGAPYDKPLLEKEGNAPAEMTVTESDRAFWSFQPLADPEPPKQSSDWVRSEIDQFVLAGLQEKKLSPNPAASDRNRIRRAYLTVVGLPPTPDQIESALSKSHAELVDELLASPHYGERWARHWLDAARFAESHGFEQDYDRKFAYHYRDFVIKALNSDMPWDQFVRWQIAGDEIAPDNSLAMMATGFLGAGVFPTQLTEKEFESARYDELDDMVATAGTAMLGLTIGCARCHDHKFDPIPMKDYYQLVSTFTTTIRSEIDIDLDSEAYRNELTKWEAEHAKLVAAKATYEAKPGVKKAFENWLSTGASSMPPSAWSLPEVLGAVSSQKASTLTLQPDGAILATGNAPAKETYTVKVKPGSRTIRFVRVEALTHPSMKRNGPGRAGNGNFALSDFKVHVVKGEGTKEQLKFASAKATHQQNTDSLSVASSFDDNPDGTGWAVDFGGIGKDQAAVFAFASPVEIKEDATLELSLRFSNNGQHSMGRFRISVSGLASPPVEVGEGDSSVLTEALTALEKGSLNQKHRETLFNVFAETDTEWGAFASAIQKSLAAKPQPSTAKVQVTADGFPPTKHHADGRGFPHFYKETHYLNRGDPNQKTGVAEQGFLQVLMRNGKTSEHWQTSPPAEWTRSPYRRLNFASWITDAENGAGHLLSRVAVNRVWHHHFGRGLVSTPNDFGLQGALPSHPELLDFLARRFIANGWNLKSLHRDILLSATWLQSSDPSPEKSAIDPYNQFLWRFTPRRLEAEIVRDSILAASGQLDVTMFGPGTLNQGHQRRSIYFMIKRSRLVPMMQIFDQPEPLVSQGSRPSTTIAPQALLFMNNPQVVKWAGALAASVDASDPDTAIRNLYLRTLSREPSPSELRENRAFVDAQTASYGGAKNGQQQALADLSQVLFSLNEFIYVP